ncbi:MAG: hypothetical protein ACLFUP_03005, partial [Desulfobacteraceae bacterium]
MIRGASHKWMLAFVLFGWLLAWAGETASSADAGIKAQGIKLHRRQNGLQCVILLNGLPTYSLAHGSSGLSLILDNPSAGEEFMREAEALEEHLSIHKSGGDHGLEIVFPLPSQPVKSGVSWMGQRRGLYLDVAWAESESGERSSG